MKNCYLLSVFILIFFSLQCKRNTDFAEETFPEIPPSEIYPSIKMEIDRNTNFLYFPLHGDLATYNYQIEEIRQRISPTRLSYHFDIGYNGNGAPEVYIGQINKIIILDGISLDRKDSITVFKAPYRRLISSIEASANNLFVVGACENRAILFNGETNMITAEPPFVDECIVTKSFVNQEENSIGVIGIGYNNRHDPVLVTLDKFDFNGKLIGSQSSRNVDFVAADLIVTNDKADYFVTGRKLFSKKDLSEITTLNNGYIDMVLSDDGQFMYGLLGTGQQIHIINYSSGAIERNIELDTRAVRLFLDDNTLIVVHAYLIGAPFSEEENLNISKIAI